MTNEPKKSEIEAAARAKWPSLLATKINHRKHTMDVIFGNGEVIELRAPTHRALLEMVKNYA